jgi:hypothetical protein
MIRNTMRAVDAGGLKSGRFGDPQAARIHQREDAAMDRVADQAQKLANLRVGQGIGQPLLLGLPNLFLTNKGQSQSSVWQYRNLMP